ncbi:hypothetical protein DPMN_144104 [Dreissena polymorpha]|uniref:Uncharacterized protein n=1 Tax=Dreissena polymorpha TaxID=45954 RepID=A0A9D4GHH0_DREPO|nr:hypothetical protein DPMN_144104 [Dreissena polymorpha]
MINEERLELLKKVVERQPAVILDVAAELSRRQQPAAQQVPPGPGPSAQPSWCVCTHCPVMERERQTVLWYGTPAL